MNGISDGIGQALLLYRSGNLGAARAEAERALTDHPDSPDLLQLLGLIRCQSGDLDEGVDLLERSLALAPKNDTTRQALATALLSRGRLDEAEKVSLPSDGLEPSAPLLRLRGYILQTMARFEEAAACYAEVVERNPGDWEIWNNLGNARRSAGDIHGSIEALERAREMRPDLPAIQFNLATALAQAGRLEQAASGLVEALRLAPDNVPTLIELAKTSRYLGRFDEALKLMDRVDALAPGTIEVFMERGRALAGLQRFEEAEQAYVRALALSPGLTEAWLERGLLLERGNRLAEIPALLDQSIEHGVDPVSLSHLRALALEREGRIDEALAAAEAAPAAGEPARRARLIGRLADRANRPEVAFEACAEMNRLTIEANPDALADAAAYRDHVESLADMLTPEYAARWLSHDDAGAEGRPAPIFLVGFPRSGTTLLDTMLMGHPGLYVLEEVPILEQAGREAGDYGRLPTLGAEEVRRLRSVYFEALDEAARDAGDRIVVDKLPLNIAGAPLIHRLFPDAKLIFAQRHPCDVVLSCFMQSFELNPAMANFLRLDDAARLYDLVMTLWTRSRSLLPLNVHKVRYEGLVEDRESELRALVDFLGIGWDDALLDHRATAANRGTIKTPSYAQVTEPIYTRASGRWERYRSQMDPILPLLLPWAERLGYGDALAGGYFLSE